MLLLRAHKKKWEMVFDIDLLLYFSTGDRRTGPFAIFVAQFKNYLSADTVVRII